MAAIGDGIAVIWCWESAGVAIRLEETVVAIWWRVCEEVEAVWTVLR